MSKTSTAYHAGSFHTEHSNACICIHLKLLNQTLQAQYHKTECKKTQTSTKPNPVTWIPMGSTHRPLPTNQISSELYNHQNRCGWI